MVATNTNAPSLTTTPRPTSTPPRNEHVVRPGDTMYGISRQHGVELAELIRANPQVRNPDLILPGQTLSVPTTARAEAAISTEGAPTERPAASPEVQRDARARAASMESQQAARVASAPASEPSPELGQVESGAAEFRKGQEGPSIAALQERLTAVGYGVKTTSRYGATTEEVVKRFQRDHGVEQTGKVGTTTLKALNEAELQAVRDGRMVLRNGIQSGTVGLLQEKLASAGFGVEKTANFAETTAARVRDFQKARGLPADGVVGAQTLALLEGRTAPTAPSAPSGGGAAESSRSAGAASTGAGPISARGQDQMRRLLDHARSHNQGASRGRCFEYVWRYMSSSGYGKIDSYNDLPRMRSGLARDFSDYLNASPAHLREAGLQRLDSTLSPPIRSPHDPRIPAGAVIVVSPGSTGTAHPTAGDIVVKGSRPGEFINDGPAMYYGTPNNWQGQVFGVYVPE